MLPDHVKVKATAAGYHIGPRAIGDEFDMPLNKDGSEPKSKWFHVIKRHEPKPAPEKGEGGKPEADDGTELV